MNAAQLDALDAEVEAAERTNPNPSRATIELEHDTRDAEEAADRARDEADRKLLIERAGGWLLGRVADQRGRVLDLILADGHVYVKGQSTLTPGIVTILDPYQAQGLADALERGAGRVPTAGGRWLQVVAVATGLQVRDPAFSDSWGELIQLSKIEAGRMASDLRRAS
jgi:hypothetical protein